MFVYVYNSKRYVMRYSVRYVQVEDCNACLHKTMST